MSHALPAEQPTVIGIDGGGTTTRVACVGLDGVLLGYSEAGGANPNHNVDAPANVRQAIQQALNQANRSAASVRVLIAGIAGLDEPQDQAWAHEATTIPGLTGIRIHRNDADIALAGALATRPGIIAIAGTGSNIVAITETGERIENDAFHHYAGGARHLAYDLVQQALLGAAIPSDETFMQALFAYLRVASIAQLRELLLAQRHHDYRDVKRLFGGLAPIITSFAEIGSPLALAACARAATGLANGIRLLGACFTQRPVEVALMGGLARSGIISTQVGTILAAVPGAYLLVEPQLPPVHGAALLALRQAGISISAPLIASLKQAARTILS